MDGNHLSARKKYRPPTPSGGRRHPEAPLKARSLDTLISASSRGNRWMNKVKYGYKIRHDLGFETDVIEACLKSLISRLCIRFDMPWGATVIEMIILQI